MSGRLACPLCSSRFGSEVALRFHGRADHPGGSEAVERVARESLTEKLALGRIHAYDIFRVDAEPVTGCQFPTPDGTRCTAARDNGIVHPRSVEFRRMDGSVDSSQNWTCHLYLGASGRAT